MVRGGGMLERWGGVRGGGKGGKGEGIRGF